MMILRSMLFKTLAVFSCVLLALFVPGCAGEEKPEELTARVTKLFRENPRNSFARFQMGLLKFLSEGLRNGGIDPNSGIGILMSCFDNTKVDEPLAAVQKFIAGHLLGRAMTEMRDYSTSVHFSEIAYKVSKTMSPSKQIAEVCTHLQLATILDTYPLSSKAVDESLARMDSYATTLIDLFEKKHPDVYMNEQWMGQNIPNFAPDPFVHCVLTVFPLSFYYRADVAKIANQHFKLASLAFPKLLYTAKHVLEYDAEQRKLKAGNGNSEDGKPIQKCVDRRIKLGVISSVFSEGHSVAEDFGGILQRLDRNVFDVTYVYVHEKSNPEDGAAFLTANNPQHDKLVHYRKKDTELNDGAWIRRIGKEIETYKFDTILHLDLTMSTYGRRLGMERLAPVQLNTHGHPVTSGHPRNIIQHFVSWAEAELPLEQSQTHYTEELQLIPKGKIHQYYTPRISNGPKGHRISRMTKQPFDHYTRNDFQQLPAIVRNSSHDDDDINVYVCMQKPFKVFPEFDELLCGILQNDPKGHAILHAEDMHGRTSRIQQRIQAAGCDMSRVHFLSVQPPHMLMALYKTATVVLDSYPAGGCTTTREALELGKAVVTWPARLLGGRWTLGLYNTIGLDDNTKNRLVANSKEEYIAKAVEVGTNRSLRNSVEANILKVIPNMFGRDEAVEEWEKILVRVSPVKQCVDGDDESTAGNDEL